MLTDTYILSICFIAIKHKTTYIRTILIVINHCVLHPVCNIRS